MKYNNNNWCNLPKDLLILVVRRFEFLCDYVSFMAVCKSWRDSLGEFQKPCLPPTRYPFLFLAEEVAPGVLTSDCEYDSNEGYSETDDDDDEELDSLEDGYEEEKYDYSGNSIGSSRGLYSLSSKKTYNINLPEAAGRLILGLNKGWLITLGRDFEINLLQPLLRHQISLPNMLTFPDNVGQTYPVEEESDCFIHKVAVSSDILNKNTVFHHCDDSPPPIVMAIYGNRNYLGLARLGDNVWTKVNVWSWYNQDIVYHKGNFYAVDSHGDIFVCGNGDDQVRGDIRATKIASFEFNQSYNPDQMYLVESTSGSGLFLLVRCRKEKLFKKALRRWPKYRTTEFFVWRLDLNYSDSFEKISGTLTQQNELGNEAIFVGRASSVAVSSSESIKPNCIYFTDDNWYGYYRCGGGHDMGIFSMEHRTIEPHFQEKSIHPTSPPFCCTIGTPRCKSCYELDTCDVCQCEECT